MNGTTWQECWHLTLCVKKIMSKPKYVVKVGYASSIILTTSLFAW